jgi:protein transport protein SEC24
MMDVNGVIKLPPLVRLSSELLTSDGAFLLEDGQRMFLWLGKSLPSNFSSELINQESYHTQFSTLLPANYEQPEQLSTRVHNLINSIRQSHRSFEPLTVVKQGEVGEMRFFSYLVEDKGLDTMNYVDFLCHVHRQIQGKL